MNRIIRFDSNFLPSSQRGRLSVVCDEGTEALQWISVARVAAQQAGYFENTVAGKLTEPWDFFGGLLLECTVAAQSVCRQIKLKIDPFTYVFYTWNVYLATYEWRSGYNITNKMSFSQSMHVKAFTQQK